MVPQIHCLAYSEAALNYSLRLYYTFNTFFTAHIRRLSPCLSTLLQLTRKSQGRLNIFAHLMSAKEAGTSSGGILYDMDLKAYLARFSEHTST